MVPGTDVTIEKGTKVIIPVWGLQMDPEYYPNPEVFDPERFNDENKNSRPDFTFLPFGDGPRMCIGTAKIYFTFNRAEFITLVNIRTP